jgi:hypothetical protein
MVNTRNSSIRQPEPGVTGVGQKHKELTPTNPRLWNIVVMQAKAKFHKWPSPAASHWAHDKYKQMGGRFKSGDDDTDERAKKLASHQKIEKAKDDGGDADKKTKDERASGRKNPSRSHKKKR